MQFAYDLIYYHERARNVAEAKDKAREGEGMKVKMAKEKLSPTHKWCECVYLARNFQQKKTVLSSSLTVQYLLTRLYRVWSSLLFRSSTPTDLSSFSKASFEAPQLMWFRFSPQLKLEVVASRKQIWWWFTAPVAAASLVDFWFALIFCFLCCTNVQPAWQQQIWWLVSKRVAENCEWVIRVVVAEELIMWWVCWEVQMKVSFLVGSVNHALLVPALTRNVQCKQSVRKEEEWKKIVLPENCSIS